MNLADMTNYVCSKVGQTDEESQAQCRMFLARRYEMIWDSALWRDTLSLVTFTSSVGSDTVLLPLGIERVLKLRVGTNTVRPFDAATVFDFNPGVFDGYGSEYGFLTLAPVVAGPLDSTTAFQILLAGNPSGDGSAQLVFEYENDAGGNSVSSVTLGADASPSAFAKYLVRADKPVTTAAYQFYTPSDGVFFTFLKSQQSAPRRVRIRLLKTTDTALDCMALGKRRCPRFETFNSTAQQEFSSPLLMNCENALMAFAQGDMLERQRQYAKAQVKTQEGQRELQIMLDLEKIQSASEMRIIPEDSGGFDEWSSYGGFGSNGKGFW